jgi:hypothetical protein
MWLNAQSAILGLRVWPVLARPIVIGYGADTGMGGQTHIGTIGCARIGHARGDSAYDRRCAAHTILGV